MGEAVDHLSGTVAWAPLLLSLLRVVSGEKLGAEVWADYGHDLAYGVYWWAIPCAKLFLGMYVVLAFSLL